MSSDKDPIIIAKINIDQILDTLNYYKIISGGLAVIFYFIVFLILIQDHNISTEIERQIRMTAAVFGGLIGLGFTLGTFLLYAKEIDVLISLIKD